MGVDAVKAADWIEEALSRLLPPNVPPFHRRVVSAQYIKLGRHHRAVMATLEMVDGLEGCIEVRKIWGADPEDAFVFVRWQDFPGAPLAWDGKEWRRVAAQEGAGA